MCLHFVTFLDRIMLVSSYLYETHSAMFSLITPLGYFNEEKQAEIMKSMVKPVIQKMLTPLVLTVIIVP